MCCRSCHVNVNASCQRKYKWRVAWPLCSNVYQKQSIASHRLCAGRFKSNKSCNQSIASHVPCAGRSRAVRACNQSIASHVLYAGRSRAVEAWGLYAWLLQPFICRCSFYVNVSAHVNASCQPETCALWCMWSSEKACYVVVAHPLVTEIATMLFRKSLATACDT